MSYLIGIDLGTQGTKAGLCDETGSLLTDFFVPSNLIYPEPGAVEQDPEEMLLSVLKSIKQVLEQSKISPGEVAGICIDGQMAGIMAVDAAGRAVTPYDSWLDTRCGKSRQAFLDFGEERTIEFTGGPVSYAHGPKIIWWRDERPDVYKRIYRFVQPASYCVMRLCGLSGDEAFIDYTYLHFSGFADTAHARWSEELIKGLGIQGDKLPRIVRPWDKMGGLTREMAAECGLLPGTPVVAGCGDTAASSFGAGIVRSGLMFDVAGTAAALACAVDIFAPDVKYKTIMFARSVVEGLYIPLAYANGSGLCLKWLRDDILGGAHTYKDLDEMAAKVPAGSGNLLFMPHFSGRVCPNDTLVRGSYINLGWNHTAAHLYRAILEGIAYEYGVYLDIIKELVPDNRFERVICVGGGAKSALFTQIKADILGIPFSLGLQVDTAVLACCAIAGYGVGLYQDLAGLVQRPADRLINPNPGLYEFYNKRKDIYSQVFDALHGIYSRLLAL
jgi:xylulokinase